MYGLKKSARDWYITFKLGVAKIGFSSTAVDECLFVGPHMTLLIIHVDDIEIAGPSKQIVDGVYEQINDQFEATWIGPASYYLGIPHPSSILTIFLAKAEQIAYG